MQITMTMNPASQTRVRVPSMRITDQQWSYVKAAQHLAASRKIEIRSEGKQLLHNIADAKQKHLAKLRQAAQQRQELGMDVESRETAISSMLEQV
ncbi:hypothetical protein GUITHDRAFT_103310 [Guillardia theta CCMP2712]|uniref:Uncharacterized protein n=1 Tax=Guillardia theta (strain CCMP2712) TaxID=905079 RepID=L1JR07_GUITC|nr:hypothetical protein GUITHDRAFT_103310 [Guillardia theta CCMP2712]EKX50719.1 hypothetical protein GUITHDRAFT_103310 [Guillardia theta CCMP2712]|eukprot:XP_005837699.1 hypothetical protein GUITHDRAFT_103310 [Guillardia theta CCMP2712]